MRNGITRSPLMLLCVYRPYKEHRSWHISAQASAKCLDRYREITLRPLNPQESRRLVGALLDIENLPESIRESILRKAEGNPFFVEEVIRSLIECGVVYQEGDRWVAKAEVEDITIPDTIQSVIMSRIDRLEDEARYVLQSASVIGRLFRHRLLGYITKQEQRLDEYLWKLEERDLVYEERAIPELEYSFRHALTQETAYNTILSRRRREFHLKVAEGYEALYSSRIEEYYEELAYHYSRSDDMEKALHYLVKAGDKSRDAFANDAAISYYQQAIKLIDNLDADSRPDSTMGHIYHSLGEIYFPLLEFEDALECCHKALEYATDKKQRARIYGMIGWIHEQKYHQLDTALEYLNLGIAELGDDTECTEMAWISIPLFWVTDSQGDTEKAMEVAQHGLEIVEGTEHYFEIAELCRILSSIYMRSDFMRRDLDKAYEYARKSLEAAQRSGNLDLMGRASVQFGGTHIKRGEYDAGLELYEAGIDIARKTGDAFLLGKAYDELSEIYRHRKDWDRTIEYLERCVEILGHPFRAEQLSNLAFIYIGKGDTEKAIEYSKEALESVEALDNKAVTKSLVAMEESLALAGKWEEFIPYCRKLREEKAGAFRDLKLNQWYLEAAEVSELFTQIAFLDKFNGPDLRSEWEWVNPRGDSSYSLPKEKNWLEIQAASGSVLWGSNCHAPRLLQEVSGDFALEVRMKASLDDLPSVGGLLAWVDQDNGIRFERGMRLKNEIDFWARIHGKWDYFGRGRLPSETHYLRLERTGHVFSAYCSGDGENWLTCGHLDFPTEDPIKVGVYAIGWVSSELRSMDTATQFGSFRVLRRASKIS